LYLNGAWSSDCPALSSVIMDPGTKARLAWALFRDIVCCPLFRVCFSLITVILLVIRLCR
jgi:hypothetical protein